MHDLRFAFRQLTKSPGFSIVAIATLAIAIGVNSAIFSLVNSLFLRPLVPSRPAEVVNIFTARKEANRDYRQFSYAEFSALRESNPVFREVAALGFTLVGVGRDEALRRSFVFFVSDNFFSLLGVSPAAGRFFTAAETRPNSNVPAVVAGYSFWQRMGGSPDFIGSTIQVNGQPLTVVGITPRGFSGVSAVLSPDLWLPLGVYTHYFNLMSDGGSPHDLALPTTYALNLMGRLKSGLTVASAASLLPTLARRLDALQPPEAATAGMRELQIQPPSRLSISSSPTNDPDKAIAGLMLAMAAVVLLIACLNLANMLLARGATRAKEIAIRLSLGAPRWRVVRQLLVEGLLLALAGGALGLLIAQWSDDLLAESLNGMFRSMSFSLSVELRPDGRVLFATILFAVAATITFSLGPALKAVRVDLVNDLKQQTGDPAAGGRWNRFFSGRHCLVMAQISLSLVLLFSGGLFFRGALKAAGLDLGFDPTGGVIAELDFSMTRTPEAAARRRMLATLGRIQELPGVHQAALTTMLPYSNVTIDRRVMPAETAPAADPKAPPPGIDGMFSAITPDFFDAIGVRLVHGRKFTVAEAENRLAPPVAIIDSRMAKALFPDGEALGRRIRYTTPPTDGSPAEMEIVGIVSEHRHQPRIGDAEPHLYVPFAQSSSPSAFAVARCAVGQRSFVASTMGTLRKELRAFDPDLPVLRWIPFSDLVDGNFSLWGIRLGAVMFGAFGGIALLLAVVGVYAVKAYAVARRTREIGIRMALGAMPADVFALIMKQGARQIAFAVVAGVVLSLLVGKALSGMLFNVRPTDPLVLGTAIAVLAGSALIACYLPARRATKVDPMTALRAE
jgi:putative ABC transport system permease protein